jgi:hypothetical protein
VSDCCEHGNEPPGCINGGFRLVIECSIRHATAVLIDKDYCWFCARDSPLALGS